MFLESKSKFCITNMSKERPFTSPQFFSWSTNNMYRTSYNDMSVKVLNTNLSIIINKLYYSHQLLIKTMLCQAIRALSQAK